MKKNRKDKGFSLVELLATITILGVISTIGIVSVQGLIENSKRTYYQSQKDTLVMAAQAYLNDHVSEYPKEIGQEETFDLKKLYTNRYVKEMIKDTNKVYCNEKQSVVVVKKEGQKKYTFKGYLKCTACEGNDFCEGKEDEDDTEKNGNKPTLSIGCSGDGNGNGNADGNNIQGTKVNITVCAGKMITNSDDSIECDTKTENGKEVTLSSYSYKIYKKSDNDATEVLVYNSKSISGKDKTYANQEIDVSKYLPGSIRVEAKAINSLGKSNTLTYTKSFTENEYAKCGAKRYDIPNKLDDSIESCTPGSWININTPGQKVRQVWVTCNDQNGIGCSRPSFSGTYSDDANISKVYVYDQKNNATACRVPVCLDIHTPEATLKIYKLNSKGKRDGELIEGISAGGNKEKSPEEGKLSVNEWYNIEKAPYGVEAVVKISDPKGTSGLKRPTEVKQNEDGLAENVANLGKYSPKIDDSQQMIEQDGAFVYTTQIKTSGYKKYKIVISDNAGNVLNLTVDIKLDLTAPTCESKSSSETWSKCPATVVGTCTDGISGCKEGKTTITKTSTTDEKVSPPAVQDNAGNKTKCPAVQVKCDDCTNTKKETGNCHNFDSCSATCGSGTVYGKKTGTRTYNYVSKEGNNFVCSSGTEECTESCSKSCDDHLYLCRTGNTCLNTKPGVYTSAVCKYAKPQFWDFYGVKVGQDYIITQGEYAGYYVYNGCLSDKAVDCTGHCKSF